MRTLTLGAYTTPREVYGRDILPAFAAHWRSETGEDVKFQASYLGSGAQARAIIAGFEADVAALSLEADIEALVDAKLITRDWKARHGGMVTRSIVVVAVRPGNPKNIRDWADLRQPGLEVLTPNPKTSGGAMWNIAAIYGAAMRGATPVAAGKPAAAERFLAEVLRNVTIMDKGARESMITFENGIGDAAITYENEVIAARQAGKAVDYVVPRSTILIENPVAVVDAYAEKHGNRDLAEAFVGFLTTPEIQRKYEAYGFRPVDAGSALLRGARPQEAAGQFTIRDLGGWPHVVRTLFASGAAMDRVGEAVAAGR